MAELPETERPNRLEQLWARRIGEAQFEVCCIPFRVYGLALGDVVVTGIKGAQEYVMTSVMKHSGHSTYRVLFEKQPTDHRKLVWELEEMGALVEHYSTNLLAVDAPNPFVAEGAVKMLTALHDAGALAFEIGWDGTGK